MKSFLHRLVNWEYWPAWLFNIPVLLMWIVQGIIRRDLLFFSCVNPDIITGGFFSEEKWPIYQMFDEKYIPKSLLVLESENVDAVNEKLKNSSLSFPVLVKPNIGERGMGIQKIESTSHLSSYIRSASYDFIIQEFVPYSKEMSILAYADPNKRQVEVTSVCLKQKLSVVGDGKSTLRELALSNYRAKKQWPRLKNQFDPNLILAKDETLLLEPIGNHSRGTTFLNGNDVINEAFRKATETLMLSMKSDIQYGRFDIIYSTLDAYSKLAGFKVVEFNGVGSEPAHIYQPGYPLLCAYKDLWHHAKILGRLSSHQKKKGISSMKWSEFFAALRLYRSNMKKVIRNSMD